MCVSFFLNLWYNSFGDLFMVITLENISFRYIEKYLFNKASISFTDTDKVGIVGVNGTGKSTLLKIICGLEHVESGSVTISGNMVINYLEQDPIFPDNVSILDTLMAYSTKEHPINDYEAKSILSKLKLTDYDMLTNNLSGGEKKRLALASVLVKYCDILILDEPTNHLDNEMITWLEKYLMKFNKGLLMVTHDRYFLERVCQRMVEIDNGKIYSYMANYSRFLELKEERLTAEAHQQKKLKSILKTELEWMRRGALARTTKSKSRIDRFNKLNEIEFAGKSTLEIQTIKTRLGKKLVEIENASKSYGNKVLFKNFNISILRTDVIGFVGANGAGKTSLFKMIMQQEKLDSGNLSLGETLKIGYFSQKMDLIDPEIRVIDYIKEESQIIETLDGKISAKSLLETFMFDSDMQYSKVKMLSGGEKRRLQLLRVLMTNPNLLILDEPTNDLDIYTLEILENYLEGFHGPILVVSHDRYFLDKICNRLFVFENGYINEYMGTFSEYIALDKATTKVVKEDRNIQKNKMSSKERSEFSNIEKEIEELEKQLKSIELEEKNNETNFHKLVELATQKETLQRLLDGKIERFFYLSELNESFKH